jgi:hypothetical protein
MCKFKIVLVWQKTGYIAASCKHDDESLGCIELLTFLGKLSDYELIRKCLCSTELVLFCHPNSRLRIAVFSDKEWNWSTIVWYNFSVSCNYIAGDKHCAVDSLLDELFNNSAVLPLTTITPPSVSCPTLPSTERSQLPLHPTSKTHSCARIYWLLYCIRNTLYHNCTAGLQCIWTA